jgi:pyrimidine-nucleoside phosphorylase
MCAVPTTVPEILDRKRVGERLSRADLDQLIGGYLAGTVPDYQVSAWLMAVCCNGMDAQELADLTDLMAASGRVIDLGSVNRPVVDKHSTGGVGDKVSLIVVPLVAALGVGVAKLSGRGLGFTGGTLDKLESFPGFQVELTPDQLVQQVSAIGAAIAGQSPDLAPADGKLYALRDVTGTVSSVPLIASSVMSKKLAAGAPSIVLDVKQGRGAFMQDLDAARVLARCMVEIGRAAGRHVTAFVSDMDRPLGRMVGNALEIREAIEVLGTGQGDPRLVELVTTIAGEMLFVGGAAADTVSGRARATEALTSGVGLAKLREIVKAQGGDAAPIDDASLLPTAPAIVVVCAERAGIVADIDPMPVARVANRLGAGRARKGDPIDHAVGVELVAAVGIRVSMGDVLARIHARDEAAGATAVPELATAISVSSEAAPARPVVLERDSTAG